jgi:hypothetical protein
MTRFSLRPVVLLLAASGLLLAQTPADSPSATASDGGWRHVGDAPPATATAQAQAPAISSSDPTEPVARDAYGQVQAQQPANRPPAAQPVRPAYGIPAQVTLKPGTFVSMRVHQELTSNHNAAGDTFSGSLMQPIVVDGIVVAQRGQTVYGRVVEADKVKGVSRLGIELNSLTLADGSQAAVHTQLVSRQDPAMPGRQQAGAITTATATGAAAGSATGPGAGAAAGTVGVLATRNHPSVIYPETALTFQTVNALAINTGNSVGAFRYVGPDDYGRTNTGVVQQAPAAPRTYVYGPGYPYPYYPYYYPYYGWGPGIFIGGGFGFGGGFRFGGFGWRR